MFDYTDNLRLEIEVPPAGLPNLVKNPSAELGAWGWVTPVNNTRIDALTGVFEFVTTVSQPSYFTTEHMPVAAGKYVSARFNLASISASHNVKVRFEWYDSAKALISSSTQSGAFTTGTNYYGSVQAPAGTAYVKFRFDFYNGAGNPSANAFVDFNTVMVTYTNTGSVQTIRTNLIKNPSMETNSGFWYAPNSTVSRNSSLGMFGTSCLQVVRNAGEIGALPWYYSDAGDSTISLAVTPGKDYTFSGYLRSSSTTPSAYAYFEFKDAANNTVGGSGTHTSVTLSTSAWTRVSVTGTAPAGAVKVAPRIMIQTTGTQATYGDGFLFEQSNTLGAYFDGSSTGTNTYAWNGTANASTSTETTPANIFAYSEPFTYQNYFSASTEVTISKQELDTGLMSVTLFDEALDPGLSTSPLRPGRRIRLRAKAPFTSTPIVAGNWYNLYEGTIKDVTADYGPRARDGYGIEIHVSAENNVTVLTEYQENRVVSNTADLAYLLEGKGVPWNINGSGNQVNSATVVAYNDNTTMLDQIVITRDTKLAKAWVDRNNVLQIADSTWVPSVVSYFYDSTPLVDTQPETFLSWTDAEANWNTDDCINSVSVKWLRYDAGSGQTTEITYPTNGGTYQDSASVGTWGVHTKEFTICDLPAFETESNIAGFASAVLARNATPTIKVRSLTYPVKRAEHIYAAFINDLYSDVWVHYAVSSTEVIDARHNITAIEQSITPDGWTVTYRFADSGAVAAPTPVPSPPFEGTTTGWQNATLVNSWSNYGAPYATAQYRRDGAKVALRGLIRNGTPVNGSTPAFTLPVGYRPASNIIVSGVVNIQATGAASTGTAHTHNLQDIAARININPDGTVCPGNSVTTASNGYWSLTGIEFYVD